jgi:hypothetical protein
MILDLNTMFSGSVAADGTKTGQAITVTALSDNVLDLKGGLSSGPVLKDMGLASGEMWLVIQALTAAAGADAAKTVTITLLSDSTTNLATSPTTHWTSPAWTGAQITAGAVLGRIKLPSGDYERYLGLNYTASATFTSFTLTAYITPAIDRSTIYPVGFTVT